MTPQNSGKDARNEQNFGDQPEKNSARNRAEQARLNQHEQTPRGQYQSGQGRYGLRFENMSAEELEYYRPFWEEKPDPDAVPPELIDHLKVRARRRLVNALSLIAVAVGVTLTLSGMLSGALYLSLPGLSPSGQASSAGSRCAVASSPGCACPGRARSNAANEAAGGYCRTCWRRREPHPFWGVSRWCR